MQWFGVGGLKKSRFYFLRIFFLFISRFFSEIIMLIALLFHYTSVYIGKYRIGGKILIKKDEISILFFYWFLIFVTRRSWEPSNQKTLALVSERDKPSRRGGSSSKVTEAFQPVPQNLITNFVVAPFSPLNDCTLTYPWGHAFLITCFSGNFFGNSEQAVGKK